MKKFLTAVLALVVVASIASVAAFAADGPTVKVVSQEVPVGTTEVVVEIKAVNLPEGGIAAVGATIDGDDALTATATANGGHGPLNLWGPLDATGPMNIMLAVTAPISEDAVMGTITYTLPADAAEGDEYVIDVVSYDANNTFAADYSALEFALEDGSIKIVAEPVTTEPVTTEPITTEPITTEPATSETEPATESDKAPVESDKAPVESDKAPVESEDDTTEAPKDTVAPPTGDMVFVVLAVMVVALGAAIVVKKVNVK